MKLSPLEDRARASWWAFVLVLAAAAAFIAYTFVEVLALGLFGYYATRRINRWIGERVDSDSVSAWITIGLVVVPVIVLALYAASQAFGEAQKLLGGSGANPFFAPYLSALPEEQRAVVRPLLRNPGQLFSSSPETLQAALQVAAAAVNMLLLVLLGVGLSYFLLVRDDALSDGLVRLFGGRDTTVFAYAAAVDEDLESVFFGNFLFVIVMSGIAALTYLGTNAVAPEGLHVPLIFTLALLTGAASLVPVVVGKIVYVPVVLFLAVQASRTGGAAFAFVGGVLVVYFLVLDILPQTFIQPYITGRQLDMMVLMFAYLLGPVMFGWYGFFLLPIIFILMLEALRIVLPELVHGERLTPTVSMGDSVGSDLRSAHWAAAESEAEESEADEATGGGTVDS